MKKEVRTLREKAINSLILSVEYFNRPSNRGRSEAVLMLLAHSFEMLLKASLSSKNKSLWETSGKKTITFTTCINITRNESQFKFLTDEQAILLKAINDQRNSVQHYFLDISESELYVYAQGGLTTFRDIHDLVFSTQLALELPERVLPVSTIPPRNINALFEIELDSIRSLLTPGRRRKTEAIAKLRSLATLEAATSNAVEPPSERELTKICNRLASHEPWETIFPGIATLEIYHDTSDLEFSLRFSKKEGAAVRVVTAQDDVETHLVRRDVDLLGYYTLSPTKLATNLGLSIPRLNAALDHFGLKEDKKYFKEFKFSKSTHKQYSKEAELRIRQLLEITCVDDIWTEHQARKKKRKT